MIWVGRRNWYKKGNNSWYIKSYQDIHLTQQSPYLSSYFLYNLITNCISKRFRWFYWLYWAASLPFSHEFKLDIVAKCLKINKNYVIAKHFILLVKEQWTNSNTFFLLICLSQNCFPKDFYLILLIVAIWFWHCAAYRFFHLVCVYFTNLISHNIQCQHIILMYITWTIWHLFHFLFFLST